MNPFQPGDRVRCAKDTHYAWPIVPLQPEQEFEVVWASLFECKVQWPGRFDHRPNRTYYSWRDLARV